MNSTHLSKAKLTIQSNNTLAKLTLKATSSLSDNVRMPSIKSISSLLTECNIKHDISTRTNTVEHRSKGNRYVNSRYQGKSGLCLTVTTENCNLELNTSDSYYSYNTRSYASKLVELIESKTK